MVHDEEELFRSGRCKMGMDQIVTMNFMKPPGQRGKLD